MEDRRRVAWAAVLVAVAACAALPATTTANKISVNRQPSTNCTVWEQTHGPFYKGDWLVFYYTAEQADVVEVNESGYNRCIANNAIYKYSKGRSFAFELNETKTCYFFDLECSISSSFFLACLSRLLRSSSVPSLVGSRFDSCFGFAEPNWFKH